MVTLDQKLELFIKQAQIPSDLKANLYKFFTTPSHHPRRLDSSNGSSDTAHVLLKRCILYYFRGSDIVNTHVCPQNNTDATVYTFDGEKINCLKPEYYLGKSLVGSSFFGAASDGALEIEMSNNNNNNNNNNGNNNG